MLCDREGYLLLRLEGLGVGEGKGLKVRRLEHVFV